MNQKQLLIIVDYNLVRRPDVALICDYARRRYQLKTVLVRAKPTDEDRRLSAHVIDLDPLEPGFVAAAKAAILRLGIPRALLPFSDNAVATGAALAEELGLAADSSERAKAAFSKITYRSEERLLEPHFRGQMVMVPRSTTIRSLDEMLGFFEQCSQGMVIKPSCEGNNRGVVSIMKRADILPAFEEVKGYLPQGLICEERIDFAEEYSWDGIGHLAFTTKKSTHHGRYPVENGQTVSSTLPQAVTNAVGRAGRLANMIVGQRIGPYHNEIKLDPMSGLAAVIEPNRRPAGMKIWHLAEKVFGHNLFHLWVDALMGAPLPESLSGQGMAAIRMLPAACDGTWNDGSISAPLLLERILSRPNLQALTHWLAIEWFGFELSRQSGESVSAIVSDNSGFIASICASTAHGGVDLAPALDAFEAAWLEVTRPLILSSRATQLAEV